MLLADGESCGGPKKKDGEARDDSSVLQLTGLLAKFLLTAVHHEHGRSSSAALADDWSTDCKDLVSGGPTPYFLPFGYPRISAPLSPDYVLGYSGLRKQGKNVQKQSKSGHFEAYKKVEISAEDGSGGFYPSRGKNSEQWTEEEVYKSYDLCVSVRIRGKACGGPRETLA